MKKIKHIYYLLSIFCAVFACTSNPNSTNNQNQDLLGTKDEERTHHEYLYGFCTDSLNINNYTVNNGENPALILSRLGFSPYMADSISRITAKIIDPTKVRAGMSYYTFTEKDSLARIQHIVIAKSRTNYVVINFDNNKVNVYEYTKATSLKRKYSAGTITSSLWNVIKEQGANPLLALKLSDVFAWQIDFFDVKEGDSFEVIYDIAYIDDTTELYIDKIKGAKFTHQGRLFTAIPFTQDSVLEYFDVEGNSLRKAFLKAPLDFFRITSRFTNARFHPILKRYRAHHGVDYAAPIGTPVKSIGAGTVIAKGYMGGGGNTLKVKHNSVYTTSYMHLSKYAKNIQVGSHVQQGQVIAYVGSTGLSTGPHLDFRVYKNGTPINPLNMEAPPSLPVKPEYRDSFNIVKKIVLNEIDSLRKKQEIALNTNQIK